MTAEKESPASSNRVKYNTWYYGREVSGSAYPWCMAFVQFAGRRDGKGKRNSIGLYQRKEW